MSINLGLIEVTPRSLCPPPAPQRRPRSPPSAQARGPGHTNAAGGPGLPHSPPAPLTWCSPRWTRRGRSAPRCSSPAAARRWSWSPSSRCPFTTTPSSPLAEEGNGRAGRLPQGRLGNVVREALRRPLPRVFLRASFNDLGLIQAVFVYS